VSGLASFEETAPETELNDDVGDEPGAPRRSSPSTERLQGSLSTDRE
jgi:hypothetical protein